MATLLQLVLPVMLLAQTTLCEFTNPATQNEVLILGQPLRITYRGIKFQNYSIALWQQFPQGGAANLGPAIYETRDGPSKGFDWVVQLYEFDLDYSNKFFFWLFEGDYSSQGHPSQFRSMVSGYFIISTSKTAPSALPSSSNATATSSTTTTTTTTPTASQASATSTPLSSQGLSVSAKIGVAIGVLAAGLTLIGAVGLLLRYRAQRRRARQDLSASSVFYSTPYCSPVHPGADLFYKSHDMVSKTPPSAVTHYHHSRRLNREPIEMGV